MENEARRREKLEKASPEERDDIEKNEAAQIESVKAYDAKTGGDSFINMTEQKKKISLMFLRLAGENFGQRRKLIRLKISSHLNLSENLVRRSFMLVLIKKSPILVSVFWRLF